MTIHELQPTPEIAQLLRECEQIIIDTLAEPDALHVSGYLTRPCRSESEARRDIAIERAPNVVRLPTEGLPPGKTVEQALERAVGRRKHLWYSHEWMLRSEEDRLDELVSFCTRLYGGDATAGQLLASAALYE